MANATLVCVMMDGKLAATVAVRIVILIAMVALLMLIVKNVQAVTQIRDGVVTCAMCALREQICAVSTVTLCLIPLPVLALSVSVTVTGAVMTAASASVIV